jgi:hypothetical protein
MTNELSIYQKAKYALAEYKTIDEVKDIRDKAMALKIYASQAGDRTLEADATEARLRAERRLGEIMEETPKARGDFRDGHEYQSHAGVSNTPALEPTLASQGIDKNLARRARAAAALPEDIFEVKLAGMRQEIIERGRGRLPEFRPLNKQAAKRTPIIADGTVFDAKFRRTKDEWASFYRTQPNIVYRTEQMKLANCLREWADQIEKGEWL